MAEIQYKLTTDNSQFLQGTLQADQAQAKLATGAREFEKDSKKAYDEAGKGSKKYGDETEKTTEKTLSLKAQLRQLKAQLADATDPKEVERLAKAAGALADQIGDAADAAAVFATDSPFEAVGNSIGSVGSKLRNLDFKGAADQSKLLLAASKQITFKESLAGMKDLGTTLLNVGKALLTNPLFLIGAAVALIVANFDALKNSGGAIGGFFTGISGAVSGLVDGLTKLTDYIGLTNKAFQKLNEMKLDKLASQLDAGNAKFERYITLLKAFGKETTDVEKAKQDFIIKNSFEQLAIIDKLVRANGKATDEQKKQIKELREAAFAASNQKAVVEAQAQQKILENQKKANEEYKKNREALEAALVDLRKRAEKANIDGLTGAEKLAAIKRLSEAELAELRNAIHKKGELINKNFKFSAEQEAEFAKLKTMINREYFNGLIQLEIDAAQKKAQIAKNKNDTALANLELENAIVKNGINSIVATEGATNIEREVLEQERQSKLLEQERAYQIAKLDLVLKGIDAENKVKVDALTAELVILETRTDAISKARVKAISDEIIAINGNSALAKEAAKSSTEYALTGITEAINKNNLDKQATGLKIDWAKLFGVSDKEFDIIKSNLSKLGQEGAKILNMFLDFQEQTFNKELDVINQKKELRNQEIADLENKLKTEDALKNDGLANDSQRLRDELNAKKKQQKEALEEEKRIKKEQEKLAKDRLILQQAQQASSLVTAIAEVYAATASAGPIGVALGTLTIAAMLASFAYAQGQASAAINKSDSAYWKGGYTGDGGKYEEAGTVHKGEFVSTKETTKKHRNLLEGLHLNDNFLIQKGIEELLKNTGVTLPNAAPEIYSSKMKLKEAEMKAYFTTDNSVLEKKISELEEHLSILVKQGSESEMVMPDGTVIIKKGLNTSVIKKRSND